MSFHSRPMTEGHNIQTSQTLFNQIQIAHKSLTTGSHLWLITGGHQIQKFHALFH